MVAQAMPAAAKFAGEVFTAAKGHWHQAAVKEVLAAHATEADSAIGSQRQQAHHAGLLHTVLLGECTSVCGAPVP